MAQAGPELPQWWDQYSEQGLFPYGVSIQDSLEGARSYWEGTLGVAAGEPGTVLPWAADQTFSTGQFFEGPTVGTPAYIYIDLSNMEIIRIDMGYSGAEETIFQPYLR